MLFIIDEFFHTLIDQISFSLRIIFGMPLMIGYSLLQFIQISLPYIMWVYDYLKIYVKDNSM